MPLILSTKINKPHSKPNWVSLVFLIFLSLSFTSTAFADLTLVSTGTPPCPVVYDPAPSKALANCAKDLARYLTVISGQPFKALPLKPDAPLPDRAIVLGDLQATGLPVLPRDGFLIRVEGKRLRITGGSNTGTQYGVYGFLEDVLGCRWWTHNEEFIPNRPDITLPNLNQTHIPAFIQHDLLNQEAMLAPYKFRVERQGQDRFTGSHNLCPMLKPYAETNPNFLPMDAKGNRKFNNLHMNYTDKAMPAALSAELEKEIQKTGGKTDYFIYFAGMGDWYGGMDLSPQSKEIYTQETWTDPDGRKKPGYSATLLQMINQTAQLLEEKYPGVQVGTFAYMSLEAPPATIKPAPNVVIRVPRLRHTTVRSVNESPKNASFLRNLQRWCQLAPGRVYVWEYGANYTTFLAPFPCLYAMADNIRTYKKMGVAGVMIQGNYVSTGGDLAAVKNYVWRKLLWNPELDPKALVREFCEGYYGPAASEMINYIDTLEACVRGDTPSDADEFAKPGSYLTPAAIAQLKTIARKARALVPDEKSPEHRRVQEALVSLDVLDLLKPLPKTDPFIEKDGRLIRRDIGEYSYDRVVQLISRLRGASPTEWGSGKAYHLNLLAEHGGPVAYLASGSARLRIAPAINGKIGPVQLNQKNIDLSITASTNHGGARTYAWATDPTDQKVTITGEAGIALFGSSTKFLLNQQITTHGASATFDMLITAQRVSKEPEFASCSARYATAYADAKNLKIESWNKTTAQWATVDASSLLARANPTKGKPSKTDPIKFESDGKIRITASTWAITDTYPPLDAKDEPSARRFIIEAAPGAGAFTVTAVGNTVDINNTSPTACLKRSIQIQTFE